MKSIFLRTIPQSICLCSQQPPPIWTKFLEFGRWRVAGCCTGAPFQFHSNNNLTKKTNFQVVCSVGTRPCPLAPGTAQSHFR